MLSTPYSTGAAVLSLARLSDARHPDINLVVQMSKDRIGSGRSNITSDACQLVTFL